MYNGIGLKTPRGSGTNGYIQRNLSFKKPQANKNNYKYDDEAVKPARKPSADVLLHRSKRQVELDCLLYEEELKETNRYSEEESKKMVDSLRKSKLSKLETQLQTGQERILKEEKQTEMERLREAFGVRKDAKEGDAFKFESEMERQERLARYAEEDRKERHLRGR